MNSRNREPASKEMVFLATSSIRKSLVLVLTTSILCASLIIILSPSNTKDLSAVIIQTLASANAAAFSLLVVHRQKTNGLVGKAFTFLALGFALYLIAEVVHSYDKITLGIDTLFLSLPYALWLVGYGTFFFFIFKMYHLLGASHSRIQQILVALTAMVFFVCVIILALQTAELSTQQGTAGFLIPSAFLGLDIALVVPSALIILNPVKGPLTPIPWIFSAVLLLTIGDTLFIYTYSVPTTHNLTWMPNLFFISSYLVATAGLFWYNKFFIFNEKVRDEQYPSSSRRKAAWQ
jgi:hypothetical protein